MRYVSFIHRDEGSGYGISFPDFPGCVSVGDTVDDAIRNGCEALAFHVEGLCEDGDAVPPPRSIEAIKADPELAEWRRGADIVLVPLLLDRGSSRRVNISIDRGLLEAIDDEARQRRMTRSAFLASAARREIEAT
jgi:predicted RNase H-like HicB family nuclease